MKILSDWQSFRPPMAGYWLTTGGSGWAPTLLYWDGIGWKSHELSSNYYQGIVLRWRGLAFDPESIEVIGEVMETDELVIAVEVPR